MPKFEIPEGWSAQAYKFALDPAPAQVQAFESHNGGRRRARNYELGRVKAIMAQREAENSYGIPEHDLTPRADWSAYRLRKHWNQVKNQVAPWWTENSKEAYANGLADLAAALKNWDDSRKGKRQGARMGFPGFETKHRSAKRFTFTTGAIRVEPDRRHVVLPKIGKVRTHENTRQLERRVRNGTARVLRATVRCEHGRWFVSFGCIVQRRTVAPRPPGSIVGVDVGVKDLVVVARPDGTEAERVPAPADLKHAQRRLRAVQRAKSRRIEGSRGWRDAEAQVTNLHARIAGIRADRMHKLTTRLIRDHDVIGVETLNVKGMAARGGKRKTGLNRAIHNAAPGRLLYQIDYKAAWNGATVIKADRWFPSSKTCSCCGVVKAKLALHERTYICTACGVRIDRDLNAAVNLAKLAEAELRPSSGGAACKTAASAAAAAVKPKPGQAWKPGMAA